MFITVLKPVCVTNTVVLPSLGQTSDLTSETHTKHFMHASLRLLDPNAVTHRANVSQLSQIVSHNTHFSCQSSQYFIIEKHFSVYKNINDYYTPNAIFS